MKRTLTIVAATVLMASLATVASATTTARVRPRAGRAENYGNKLICGEGSPLCAEANDALGYRGGYTGHDEPSLLFYSDTPGRETNQLSARRSRPNRRPCPPRTAPEAPSTSSSGSRSGSGWPCATTSLRPSSRTTHARRTATRTSSTGPTRTSPTTSGSTRARPSWSCSSTRRGASRSRGHRCDPTKWCAAMAIFSLNRDQNTASQQRRLPEHRRR